MTAEPDLSRTIKEALYACETERQVNECANKYRADVKAMHENPDLKVFAVQILNLKILRLKLIDEARRNA